MSSIILKNIFGVLSVMLFFISVFLLFMPSKLRSISDFTNKWISVRKLLKNVEAVRDIDEKIISKSKLWGALSLVLMIIYVYWYLKY